MLWCYSIWRVLPLIYWQHRRSSQALLQFRETGVEADHGGPVSIALLKLLRLVPEYGHFSQNNNSVMPKNKAKISCEALKERKMKRTHEGSSQTDEDVFEDDSHGCPKCKSTNVRLAEIDEKLERLLKGPVTYLLKPLLGELLVV